jgi:hypothetical protein
MVAATHVLLVCRLSSSCTSIHAFSTSFSLLKFLEWLMFSVYSNNFWVKVSLLNSSPERVNDESQDSAILTTLRRIKEAGQVRGTGGKIRLFAGDAANP